MTEPTEPTLEDLRHRAGELEIPGRSKMSKAELEDAITAAVDAGEAPASGSSTGEAPAVPPVVPDPSTEPPQARHQHVVPGVSEPAELPPLSEVAEDRYKRTAMRAVIIDAPEGF